MRDPGGMGWLCDAAAAALLCYQLLCSALLRCAALQDPRAGAEAGLEQPLAPEAYCRAEKTDFLRSTRKKGRRRTDVGSGTDDEQQGRIRYQQDGCKYEQIWQHNSQTGALPGIKNDGDK